MVFLRYIGIFGGGEKGFSENFVDFEDFFCQYEKWKFSKKPLFIVDLKKNPGTLDKPPPNLMQFLML